MGYTESYACGLLHQMEVDFIFHDIKTKPGRLKQEEFQNNVDVKINRTSKRDKNVPEHTFVGKIIEIHPTFFVVERTDLPKRLDGHQTIYTTTFHYFDIQDELFQMRDPETNKLYYKRHKRDLTAE